VGFRKEKNIFLSKNKHANSAQISPLLKQNNYEQAEAEFTLAKLRFIYTTAIITLS
jgi:hypothetical protein